MKDEMSIDMNFDPQAAAERARAEADEALRRARELVERSRAFLLAPTALASGSGDGLLRASLTGADADEQALSGEADQAIILADVSDAQLPPADLPRLSA